MDEKGYLSQRLDAKIEWYDRCSKQQANRHQCLRLIELICASSIPVVASFIPVYGSVALWMLSVASILVVVTAGYLSLTKLVEHSLEYRSSAEALKQHKYLYLTQTPPYHQVDAFSRLVAVSEAIMAKESTRWLTYHKPKD